MNYANIFKVEEERLEKLNQYDLVKLDLLTAEQINSLEIFKKYGTKAAITDFSVVLGGCESAFHHTIEGIDLNNRTGYWWTKSSSVYVYSKNTCIIDERGDKNVANVNMRNGGCRPALPYSSISSICSNKVRGRNGILEVEFGKYPQWGCSKEISEELENLYLNNNINKTGKVYTTDSRHYDEYNKDFKSQEHIEYEYNGKKYVRVKVNSWHDGNEFTLSNGEKYQDGDFVWIEVSPIKWLVDEKNDIVITKNIIVAGIQFNKERIYTGDKFDEMNIKKFMDNYLSKEIIPGLINYQTNNGINEEKKEETLESIIKEAKKEMDEVLEDIPYQKIKK